MPTNDFLPIANAGGANVQAQVAYAADPDRTAFFPDGGIPDANQHGKMFRQTSAMATMIAQAICDIAGVDMLDDGNNATQLANLKAMLGLSQKEAYCGVSTGSANAQVVAFPQPVTARQVGVPFAFKAGFSNTGIFTLDYGAGPLAIQNLSQYTVAPSLINGVLASGGIYVGIDDGSKIQIPTLSAVLSSGILNPPTVVVPNTGTSTQLCPAPPQGGGEALITADDGSSNTVSDIVSWYQFSNTALNALLNSGGAPGTRSYVSPTVTGGLNMSRTGGPANITFSIKLTQR